MITGKIGFENLKITCIIGIEPQERLKEQEILIDLKVQLDLSKCFKTRHLEHTINYAKLSELCTSIAKHGKFELLENLGHEILEQVFVQFRIDSAWIKIKKPQAIPNASFAILEIERVKT